MKTPIDACRSPEDKPDLAKEGQATWPVIIGGFYRSGTTLLRRLLDAHPAVHCPPELKFMRDVLGEYPDDPYGHLRFFNQCRILPLSEGERLAILGRAYAALRSEAAARLGKRRWADKDPENARYLPYWEQALCGRFVYVHCLRDPLDTLASLQAVDFSRSIPRELAAQIARWRANAEESLRFFAQFPERGYCLQYESLVTEPERTLDGLLSWLGLEPAGDLVAGISDPARGRGLEDPKIDHAPGIHTDGVGRGKRAFDASTQASIWAQVQGLYEALRGWAR